jgi:hypothetical protein
MNRLSFTIAPKPPRGPAHIDWAARILDGFFTLAIALVGLGLFAAFAAPALVRWFGGLTLALTLPGLH